jgi:hypothetical protein
MDKTVVNKKTFAVIVLLVALVLAALAISLRPLAVQSANSVYSYQNESQRAAQNGYALNGSTFSCRFGYQCTKVLITRCDNNNPSQFVCINSAYLADFSNMSRTNGSVVCPQYLLAGTISCECASNYCTENYAR